MICDFCGERDAVIFLEQLSSNGQKRKINICMECALERGISTDPKSIEKSIGGLFKELAAVSRKAREDSARMCPVCGMSVGEIRRNKIAGCPECYAIFSQDIHTVLSKEGINGEYSGDMPKRLSSFKSVLTDRIMLQNKLEDAVSREDYEKAAMYRDFLRALEKKSVAPGFENADEGGEA